MSEKESEKEYRLQDFIEDSEAAVRNHPDLADIVRAVTPSMDRLLSGPRDFLTPAHFRSDPDHYARNLVYAAPEAGLSLYTLVWQPGQWTPIHDHGTWGVVGVIEGQLEEQNYMRMDQNQSPRPPLWYRPSTRRPCADVAGVDFNLRAEPGPHTPNRLCLIPAALRQPAPLWPHVEFLLQL